MTLVHPSKDDLEAVYDLQCRSDIAEYGEPDSELSDLQHEWDRLDLDQDAWIVQDENGGISGYAALVPSRGQVRIDMVADPRSADEHLSNALLACCEARALERASAEPLTSHTFLAQVNVAGRELFLGTGFSYVKSYYQMHIDLAQELLNARWPDGVDVRCARAGVDDESIYHAVQGAFERPTAERPTYEQWREHMIRPEIYDPELWILAVAAGEIVGTCLGINYETEGWIRQFGVLPAWRRKGLATALLLSSFKVFKQRGYHRVGLGMEAANTQAMRLYERVGMLVLRQYDEYSKVYIRI